VSNLVRRKWGKVPENMLFACNFPSFVPFHWLHTGHVSTASCVKGRACDYTLCVPCAQADEQKGAKTEDESLCQGPGAEYFFVKVSGGSTKTPGEKHMFVEV